MFLVIRPNNHFEIVGHVGWFVGSFLASRVAEFVGNMQMELDIAEVKCNWMIEDQKPLQNKNIQQVVVLLDLVEIAMFIVVQHELVDITPKHSRLLLIRMPDVVMCE